LPGLGLAGAGGATGAVTVQAVATWLRDLTGRMNAVHVLRSAATDQSSDERLELTCDQFLHPWGKWPQVHDFPTSRTACSLLFEMVLGGDSQWNPNALRRDAAVMPPGCHRGGGLICVSLVAYVFHG